MGIDFTGRGRLRGRALSDGRFTSMLRTVYHHLGDSWKWAHEASDFAASLFYSSISGVSKWFFPQAPSKLSTQTFKPVHNLGTITIRHSIPIPLGSPQNGGSQSPEGPNYLLRTGRDTSALGRS